MATWPTITQTGGPNRWTVWGGNITNHEAFAFTLKFAPPNTGALISDVTVYVDNGFAGGEPSYGITLTPVDQFGNNDHQWLVGNFESNGV
jgi:hypothetical protein